MKAPIVLQTSVKKHYYVICAFASCIFVFARSPAEREFALSLGAAWAGDPSQRSPRRLNAIIDTTPVWQTVLDALGNLAPGGRLVTGFQLGRGYTVGDYDSACAAAGLEPVERWATWAGRARAQSGRRWTATR